ncbi:MAG: hypothetical protein CM1200mP41_12810 [Gammaproteobacteria bacterium]|nr:MAG: hypothetical protein CM1200mP41_12810 [Gammaproteobacteria bacterium]
MPVVCWLLILSKPIEMKRVARRLLDEVIRITVAPGREILSVYQQSYRLKTKLMARR